MLKKKTIKFKLGVFKKKKKTSFFYLFIATFAVNIAL